jgi:hypothetical protein
VVARKRGYIRSLSLRTSNPSHDETFNAFNRAWLHKHFKTLLGHLLTFHPSAVDKEIIVDLLVWLPQGEKGLMARGPAIMLNYTPYLIIVFIHLKIISQCEHNVEKYNSMA